MSGELGSNIKLGHSMLYQLEAISVQRFMTSLLKNYIIKYNKVRWFGANIPQHKLCTESVNAKSVARR